METNIPNSLFKYFSYNSNARAALEKRSIWFSSPMTFNDPYDCGLTIDFEKYTQREKEFYDAIYHSNDQSRKEAAISMGIMPGWVISVAVEELKNRFENIGVCSFSEDNLNILMWSHSADEHKGFCVEYYCEEGSYLRNHIRKINYVNKIPSITIEEFNRYGENEKKNYIYELALFKSKDWEYEKEWRLITDYNNKYCNDEIKIKAIYFGARFEKSYIDVVNKIISYESTCGKIKLYNVVKKNNAFSLALQEIW